MLDDHSQSSAQWLSDHALAIAGFVWVLICALVAIVINYTTTGANQRQQGLALGKLETRVGAVEDCQEEHLADTTRHVDPVRDERRFQELKELIAIQHGNLERSLARIEAKVDTRNVERIDRQLSSRQRNNRRP